MGLFDQIASAFTGSDASGELGKLQAVAGVVEQLQDATGSDSSTAHTILSLVGTQVLSSLQDKQSTDGEGAVQNLVEQFSGTEHDPDAVDAVFTPEVQQQVAEVVADRTGLDANLIQEILPKVVPVILGVFHIGGTPLLTSLIEAGTNGDVDFASIAKLAAGYLGQR
jgi:hypothetical protein